MRQVLHQYPAQRDDIADLVTRRPLPGPGLPQVDPFLFLNHHGPQTYRPGNTGLPFGPHPHRGFETVSFILRGEMAHLDSGGHESVIRAGGVQWMTAGSGLIHAEISPASFKRDGGPLEILQLWVNLPGRLKMTKPAYLGLQREDIPAIPVEGGTVNLISGTFAGRQGPIESLTDVAMMTIQLEAGEGRSASPNRPRGLLLPRRRRPYRQRHTHQAAPPRHIRQRGRHDHRRNRNSRHDPLRPRRPDRRTRRLPRSVRHEHPRRDRRRDRGL